MAWHELGIEETIKKLETRIEGLSDREVEERLNRYGKNEIIRGKPLTPFEIFLKLTSVCNKASMESISNLLYASIYFPMISSFFVWLILTSLRYFSTMQREIRSRAHPLYGKFIFSPAKPQ